MPAPSPYFDRTYFDPAYFDTNSATTTGGHGGRSTKPPRRRQLRLERSMPIAPPDAWRQDDEDLAAGVI